MEGLFELLFTNYPAVGWIIVGIILLYRLATFISGLAKKEAKKQIELNEIQTQINTMKADIEGAYHEIQLMEERQNEAERRWYADMKVLQDSINRVSDKMDSNYANFSKEIQEVNKALVSLFKDVNFKNNNH